MSSGRDDAELVAVGVGQDHPAAVLAGEALHLAGPQALDAGHFAVEIVGEEVEVEPVLADAGLGDQLDEEAGPSLAGSTR